MPKLYSVHSAYTMYGNLFKQKKNLLEDKRNIYFFPVSLGVDDIWTEGELDLGMDSVSNPC